MIPNPKSKNLIGRTFDRWNHWSLVDLVVRLVNKWKRLCTHELEYFWSHTKDLPCGLDGGRHGGTAQKRVLLVACFVSVQNLKVLPIFSVSILNFVQYHAWESVGMILGAELHVRFLCVIQWWITEFDADAILFYQPVILWGNWWQYAL